MQVLLLWMVLSQMAFRGILLKMLSCLPPAPHHQYWWLCFLLRKCWWNWKLHHAVPTRDKCLGFWMKWVLPGPVICSRIKWKDQEFSLVWSEAPQWNRVCVGKGLSPGLHFGWEKISNCRAFVHHQLSPSLLHGRRADKLKASFFFLFCFFSSFVLPLPLCGVKRDSMKF